MLTIFIGMLDNAEAKDKLTRIYKKYYGTMLSVAKSILSDCSSAEEAVSDAIMTIIDNLYKIDETSSHKTRAYIVIIVRSRAINILNKQKRFIDEPIEDLNLPDTNASILENLTTKESFDKIVAHIKSLPEKLSDVLYLSAVMEHSNSEIANLLKISNDAVRKRLSRAISQIKMQLAEEETEYAKK